MLDENKIYLKVCYNSANQEITRLYTFTMEYSEHASLANTF